MEIFISLVIFGVSLYLFLVTNYKIRTIRESILIDDVKREMEALLTEFNGAAARNIELMEDKIGEMQAVLQKANSKIVQLTDHLDRAARPIIVEKFIHKEPAAESAPQEPAATRQQKSRPRTADKPIPKNAAPTPVETLEIQAPEKESENGRDLSATPAENPVSRSEKLKSLVRSGKSRDELIQMGYLDNEINLVHFLVGKK